MQAGARRTRVAVVGAGYIADTHLAVLQGLPVEVVAVVDLDAGAAAGLARRYGVSRVCTTVAELLDQDPPDVAHVLVPPSVHAKVASELLAGGVAVFLEKPLGTNGEEAEGLVRLAEAAGLVLGVNHNNRFHPSFVELRDEVNSGRFGRIQHLFACLHVPLRQLDSGDVRHWMFQHPKNIVFEQGTHPFSQIHELLGPVVKAIAVTGEARRLGPGLPFHDSWQISLECERGPATVLLSFGKDFAENWLHAIGQDRSMRVDLLRRHSLSWWKSPWMEFHEQGRIAGVNGRRLWRQGLRNSWDYLSSTLKLQGRSDVFWIGMRDSIRAFHEAFVEGRKVPADGAEGLAVVRMCEAVTAGVEEPEQIVLPTFRRTSDEPPTLVTGATGFLGRHLVPLLRERKVPLRLLVRRAGLVPPALLGDDVEVVTGSLEDPASLEAAVQGTKAVLHMATGGGDTWEVVERSMVNGCRELAEAAVRHQVPRFLFVSSIAAVYLGRGDQAPAQADARTDSEPGKRPVYARGKILCEELLRGVERDQGLAVTILRPGVVVGEGTPAQHSGAGLWTRDNHCFGWGLGANPVPFVLVTDVAEALCQALQRPQCSGRTLHLVGEAKVSAREWVDELRRRTRRDFCFHPQPLWWFQSIEVAKWLVKKATRRPGTVFPSYRDLKSRSLARSFDLSLEKELLDWQPVADRQRFLDQALGWLS